MRCPYVTMCIAITSFPSKLYYVAFGFLDHIYSNPAPVSLTSASTQYTFA